MSDATSVKGPLNGVRILDLTHVWAGPLATRIFGDLGAEVIKIERSLGRGTRVANVEPIAGWIGGEPGAQPWNNNAAFVKLARNAKSISLDLKRPEGRDLFLELVTLADVVIENFSARAMPSMGLDYETLKKNNPKIIYITMPGYGTHGPYKDWVAFGPTVEPMTGLSQMLGYSASEPRNTAMALMDPIAGTTATTALVAALREREQTGQGAYIEMSLHEAGIVFNGPWLIEHQLGGQLAPLGNAHPQMSPHGVYPCKERAVEDDADWIAIACQTDTDWQNLLTLLKMELNPAWGIVERQSHASEIDKAIAQWTLKLDKDVAAEELQNAGIPAGPVASAPDLLAEPHAADRGFFVPLERHNTVVPGNPIHMSGLSSDDWSPCPPLGAHSQSILQEWLGYTAEQTQNLLDLTIIAESPPD
jgi:crotonobetainyl-CoA:carnitine CoA-transferase CaiB-like acyl-CoA transferase